MKHFRNWLALLTLAPAFASASQVKKIEERHQVLRSEIVGMGECRENMVFPGHTLPVQEKQTVRSYLVNAIFDRNSLGLQQMVAEEIIPETMVVNEQIVTRSIDFSQYNTDPSFR